MKILLVHNFYGSSAPSGENQVFKNEKKMLEENGHDVITYVTNSDELRNAGVLGKIKGGLLTPWNPQTIKKIRKIVYNFEPQIAHVHNTFPIISPSVFVGLSDVKTALTFHNYRYFCPNGIPMRNGKLCTKCMDRGTTIYALKHGCYRKSRLASVPLVAASGIIKSKKILQNYVQGYIVFSEFQKTKLIQQGLDEEKIFIKPNFNEVQSTYDNFDSRDDKVVFVGRLSEEKGINDLLIAWQKLENSGIKLEIIGDGNDLDQYVMMSKKSKSIKFLGKLSHSETQLHISKAKLLVVPSRWYEGFPMVLTEAFANGTPVAVSNLGPLPEIVRSAKGAVFENSNPNSLYNSLTTLLNDDKLLRLMSISGRDYYLKNLTKEQNYKSLMRIYDAL